jgi:hypothetical protein
MSHPVPVLCALTGRRRKYYLQDTATGQRASHYRRDSERSGEPRGEAFEASLRENCAWPTTDALPAD